MGKLDDLLSAVGRSAPESKYIRAYHGSPKRLLLDDVHKVWIDDAAPLPELDPQALYHITHPQWAKRIVESGAMVPQAAGQKWGGGPASNSEGRVFFTAERGVGRWVDVIGNTMPHLFDNPPEKLAVLQFRNPHMDFKEAMARRLFELPPGNVGRPMPTQDWAPQLWQDAMGSRDAGSNSFFVPGTVPIEATPRVRRIVSRYGLLAPIAAGSIGEE